MDPPPPPQSLCCLYVCVLRWVGSGWASSEHMQETTKEESSFGSRHTAEPFLQPHMTGIPENVYKAPWDLIKSFHCSLSALVRSLSEGMEFYQHAATVTPIRQEVALSALC